MKTDHILIEGYREIDTKKDCLKYTYPKNMPHNLLFRLPLNSSLLRIFLGIVDSSLVDEIIRIMNHNSQFISGNGIIYDRKKIYMALAYRIRIQGLQDKPKRSRKKERPLIDAIDEARNHFQVMFPSISVWGQRSSSQIITNSFFTNEISGLLSTKFQQIVLSVGDSCVGDEKLFRFTGNSMHIRKVRSKPAQIGYWFYELCVPLAQGGSYLLWTTLQNSDPKIGLTVPNHTVIQQWINVVKRLGNPHTLLTMDSYYLDKLGKKHLTDNKVKYIAAITEGKFKNFTDVLEPKLAKPGDWAGLYHPELSECVIHYWSQDNNIGKKFVISNSIKKVNKFTSRNIVPVYDLYKLTFAACDKFNLGLCDCTWPFRKGGNVKTGDLGVQNDFLFSCILQNVFQCHRELCTRPCENSNFESLCLELADSLYEFSDTIV